MNKSMNFLSIKTVDEKLRPITIIKNYQVKRFQSNYKLLNSFKFFKQIISEKLNIINEKNVTKTNQALYAVIEKLVNNVLKVIEHPDYSNNSLSLKIIKKLKLKILSMNETLKVVEKAAQNISLQQIQNKN